MNCFALFTGQAWTQKIEITPIGGFQFGGKMDVRDGELKVEESGNYGIILDYRLGANAQIEFYWLRQDSEIKLKEFFGVERFKAAVEYWQIGILRTFKLDKVTPFSGFTFGLVNLRPKNVDLSNEIRFAVALKGGVKYFFSEKVGLRLQAELLLPIQWVGASLFCGTGGCSTGASAGTTILQGALNGGIIMAF